MTWKFYLKLYVMVMFDGRNKDQLLNIPVVIAGNILHSQSDPPPSKFIYLDYLNVL
jgi:hypothetical protein